MCQRGRTAAVLCSYEGSNCSCRIRDIDEIPWILFRERVEEAFLSSVPVFFFLISFSPFLPSSLPLFFCLSTFLLSLKSFSFLPPSLPVFSLLSYYKSMLVITTSKIQTINLLPGKQGKASPTSHSPILQRQPWLIVGVYPSRYTFIYVCKIQVWGFFFY